MVQAVGSIAAIIVSVAVALYLQNRARRLAHDHEVRLQKAALIEIAVRCEAAIERLDRKANEARIKRTDIAWLKDELSADVAMVDAIDVMTLRSSAAIPLVSQLQRQIRMSLRRLGYAARDVRSDKPPVPDTFEPALRGTRAVLKQLRELPVSS